jgi:hypothetical protein
VRVKNQKIKKYKNKYVRLFRGFKMLVRSIRVNYKRFFFKKCLKVNRTNKLFNKKSNKFYKSLYNTSVFKVINVIYNLNFYLFKKDILFLIKNNFFFINGRGLKDYMITFKKGDVLQCIISKELVTLSLFFLKNLKKNLIKFTFKKNFFFKKNKKHKKKIINTYHKSINIVNFIEFDYTTFTAVFIKNPQYVFSINKKFFKVLNTLYYRTYN